MNRSTKLSKCREWRTPEYSALNKTSIFYTFIPRLKDNYGRGCRKILESAVNGYKETSVFCTHQGRYTYVLVASVKACTTSVKALSRHDQLKLYLRAGNHRMKHFPNSEMNGMCSSFHCVPLFIALTTVLTNQRHYSSSLIYSILFLSHLFLLQWASHH